MPKAQIKLKPELKIIKKEEIPHLLVPGEVGAVLELTVKDKDGKVTEHRVLKSKSYVRQFLELLWIEFNKISKYSPLLMQGTDGFARDIYENEINFACDAGLGIETHGTIVGTGTTPATIDDYAMETPIDHGTDPGELEYSAVTFGAPASDATTSQFTITRNFSNGSGGAITVNEIGLYVKGFEVATDGDVDRFFMIIRDVVTIEVPDGQTLTVNYREQVAI